MAALAALAPYSLATGLPPAKPIADLTGVWHRTTAVSPCASLWTSETVCNATNLIELTLVQNGSRSVGSSMSFVADHGTWGCPTGPGQRL